MKARKGVKPVPAQTMIKSVEAATGSLNFGFRI